MRFCKTRLISFKRQNNTVLLLAAIRRKLILGKNTFSLCTAPTIICVAIMPQCASHCVDGHMGGCISGPDSITSFENCQLNAFSHITVTPASPSFRFPYKHSGLTLGGTDCKQMEKGMHKEVCKVICGEQRRLSYYRCPKNTLNFASCLNCNSTFCS